MITCPDQQLSIDMDMFWALADNKMRLQHFFIKWLTEHYSGIQPLYFGGAHPDDIASCVKIVNGCITLDRLLKCDHEEADDRILFYVSHAIKVDRYQKIVIASPDTVSSFRLSTTSADTVSSFRLSTTSADGSFLN